jgi:hypothetical protein
MAKSLPTSSVALDWESADVYVGVPSFLLLIEELEHFQLLQWISRMRKRRNNEDIEFAYTDEQLDKS